MKQTIAIVVGFIVVAVGSFSMGAITRDILAPQPHVQHGEVLPEIQPEVLPGTDAGRIDRKQAIEIALAHANVSREDASRIHARLGIDDGRIIYDVEFVANGREHWVEVLVSNGGIHDSGFEGSEYVPLLF